MQLHKLNGLLYAHFYAHAFPFRVAPRIKLFEAFPASSTMLQTNGRCWPWLWHGPKPHQSPMASSILPMAYLISSLLSARNVQSGCRLTQSHYSLPIFDIPLSIPINLLSTPQTVRNHQVSCWKASLRISH